MRNLAARIYVVVLAVALNVPHCLGVNETVLHEFTNFADGAIPYENVTFDANGNLYGTTLYGGSGAYGTVFELLPNGDGTWTEKELYNFQDGQDGAIPLSMTKLIFDRAGNLYGTTESGGDAPFPYGSGTVFQLSPQSDGTWTESTLHIFTGGADGYGPVGVVADVAGNLYGTTSGGGSNACACGTVFQFTPNADGSWTFSTIYTFTGGFGGKYPANGVIVDGSGNLYGTTETGSLHNDGAVFELSPPQGNGSWHGKVLRTFNEAYGNMQYGTLTLDTKGNLYGAAPDQVYMLSPTATGPWKETIVHQFVYPEGTPNGGLLFDNKGNLLGTTTDGLAGGNGSVFRLSLGPGGAVHILEFDLVEGDNPYGGVALDSNGNIFGTTKQGGSNQCGGGCGLVFEVSQ